MKKILYLFNSAKDVEFKISTEIISKLNKYNLETYVDNEGLSNHLGLELISKTTIKNIDFIFILGGDGTILKHSKKYNKYQLPILGINLGRVGALAQAEIDNLDFYIEKLINNEYSVEKNCSLQITIKNDKKTKAKRLFYNDMMLHRGNISKPLQFEISLDNKTSDIIYSDGVVLATPIGSTAYNLSAFGPILSRNSSCMVITPICPQIKLFNSFVCTINTLVTFKVLNEEKGSYISIDGDNKILIDKSDLITISKANCCLNLLKFNQEKESIYDSVKKIISSI